jgi:hypothetical protein
VRASTASVFTRADAIGFVRNGCARCSRRLVDRTDQVEQAAADEDPDDDEHRAPPRADEAGDRDCR